MMERKTDRRGLADPAGRDLLFADMESGRAGRCRWSAPRQVRSARGPSAKAQAGDAAIGDDEIVGLGFDHARFGCAAIARCIACA
jgi:hypothetical protein